MKTAVMLLFSCLSVLILYREGLLTDGKRRFAAALAVLLAFAVRWLMLDHQTLDYQDFLTRWVDFYRQNGHLRALKYPVGNYNVPYLVFMALFSLTEYSDLYLIKYLSVAFDVLLAWALERCVLLCTESRDRALGAFLCTLLLPTVVLNGALWGQCDSIYAALAVWGIYFGLDRRSLPSLVCAALSFAFKLQAVFFLPLWFVLLVTKRVRWRDLWAVPVTYVAAISPAVIAGRPFMETLTLYFGQTGTIGSGLNYNSSSLYAFYRGGGNEELLGLLGVLGAGLFCAVLLLSLTVLRQRLDDRVLLAAFTLSAVCIPLLLPHMHDRYFFGADALSLAAAFLSPALLPVPFLCSFASLLGYHAYLKMRYLLPMRYGAAALIFAALVLIIYMVYAMPAPPKKKPAGNKKKAKKKR